MNNTIMSLQESGPIELLNNDWSQTLDLKH